jgi:hypothetical protein
MPAAIGTKTFKKPDGSVVIVPPNVEYTPEEGESLVWGVRNIVIYFPLDGPINADIGLLAGHLPKPFGLSPRWLATDPSSGDEKEVVRVEFADGSVWEKQSGILVVE